MIERILVSIFLLGLGGALMKYRKQVSDFTGAFGWAERYLGSGGTTTAIVLIGFASTALSMLYLFGYFEFGMPTGQESTLLP